MRNIHQQSGKEMLFPLYMQSKRKGKLLSDIKNEKVTECWTKNEQKRTFPNPFSFVNITGSNRLVDPDYGILGKFIWLILIISGVVLMDFSIVDRIFHYLKNPKATFVTLTREAVISFPSVKLCPTDVHTYFHFLGLNDIEIMKEIGNMFMISVDNKLDVEANYNRLAGFKEESIDVYGPCDSDRVNCNTKFGQKIEVNKTTVNTIWGKCIVVSSENKVVFRGPFSSLRIVVNVSLAFGEVTRKIAEKLNQTSSKTWLPGVLYQVHPKSSDLNKHEIFYHAEKATVNSTINLQLTYKKFNYLNSSEKPCFESKEVVSCINDCVDRWIREKIQCDTYYLNPNSQNICGNLTMLLKTYEEIHDLYNNISYGKCKCPELCNLISFTTTTWVDSHSEKDLVELKLFYMHNTFTVTDEKYDYFFGEFLADIGGLFGFFVGFSLLTIAECFEFCFHVMLYCKNRVTSK